MGRVTKIESMENIFKFLMDNINDVEMEFRQVLKNKTTVTEWIECEPTGVKIITFIYSEPEK